MGYVRQIMWLCLVCVGLALGLVLANRIGLYGVWDEYEAVLCFSYGRADLCVQTQHETNLDRVWQHNQLLRSLQDCFDEWRYGAKKRQKPF